MSTTSRTVAGLALLKVTWDHLRQDILETFVLLVGTLLLKGGFTSIDDADVHKLCSAFEEEYGFTVPYHPMIAILNRARKRGFVHRHRGRFIPTASKLASIDISAEATKQEAVLEDFISGLVAFAKEQFAVDLTRGDASQSLVGFLRAHDLDVLFALSDNSILPEIRVKKHHRYVFARYAQQLRDNDPGRFRVLVNVAVGHILASVLRYKELDKYRSKMDDVHVYCDTRFTLRLLGAEGPERKVSYSALTEALREGGATLLVFRHTYDEIMAILQTCLRLIDSSQYDPSKAGLALTFFIQHGYTRSDIQDFINKVDPDLEAAGIAVVDPPEPSSLTEFQIEEGKLRDTIIRTYNLTDPAEVAAQEYTIDRDIKSIAAVHKLRRGRAPNSLKHSGHVFVTTNGGLARASRSFETDIGIDSYTIPTCLTDIFLGTVIWLQSPAIVRTLNETRLIAQCASTLELDDAALKRIVAVATELRSEGRVTEEQFYLLKASPVVHEMLADRALGDANAFTAKTVEEILEELEEKVRRKEVEAYLREKDSHTQTQVRLSELEVRDASRRGRIDAIASKIGRVVGSAAQVSLVVFVVVLFGLDHFNLLETKILRVGALIIGVLFAVGAVVFDYLRFRPVVQAAAERRVRKTLARLLAEGAEAVADRPTPPDRQKQRYLAP